MDSNWRTPTSTPSPTGGNNTWTSPRFRGAIYRPPSNWQRSPYQRSPRPPRPYSFRHQSPYNSNYNDYSGGDFQNFGSPYGHGGGGRGFKSHHPQQRFFRPYNPRPRNFTPSPQEHGQHNRSAIDPTNIENWVSEKMWIDPWTEVTAQVDLNSSLNSTTTINTNESESFNYSSASTLLLGDPNEIDLNDDDLGLDESKTSHIESESKQDQDATGTLPAVDNKAQETPDEQKSENALSLENENANSNL